MCNLFVVSCSFVTIQTLFAGSSESPLFAVIVWMTKWVALNQLYLYLALFFNICYSPQWSLQGLKLLL